MENVEKRVIIDLDMGSDDYLALLLLLHAEKYNEVKIEAITCCTGNTGVENVVRNAVRLLEIENRTDIPIFKGSYEPLLEPKEDPIKFHGSDGFGDLNHESEPDTSIVKNEHAAMAINNILNENPKAVSIIAVGPLTNLALAIKLNKHFKNNVKDVWIMGGNYTAVGNCTSSAEFNFFMDPEAVHIVLEGLDCPIYIFPWETCLKCDISLDWRFNDLLPHNPAFELLTKVDKSIYLTQKCTQYMPCDAFLCHSYLKPKDTIKKQSFHHVVIELHSGYTRGQLVLDHLKNKKPNVIIIEDFNYDMFKELLIVMNETK